MRSVHWFLSLSSDNRAIAFEVALAARKLIVGHKYEEVREHTPEEVTYQAHERLIEARANELKNNTEEARASRQACERDLDRAWAWRIAYDLHWVWAPPYCAGTVEARTTAVVFACKPMPY